MSNRLKKFITKLINDKKSLEASFIIEIMIEENPEENLEYLRIFTKFLIENNLFPKAQFFIEKFEEELLDLKLQIKLNFGLIEETINEIEQLKGNLLEKIGDKHKFIEKNSNFFTEYIVN